MIWLIANLFKDQSNVRHTFKEHNTMAQNVINIKTGLAEMLKAASSWMWSRRNSRVAEDAGAAAVMALERVPSDIRKAGGVAHEPARPDC